MKFLHVIGSMNPRSGGPCQGIRNLALHSLKQGNTVEVVCLDDPDSDYLATESLTIHALGNSRGPWGYHPALRPWLETQLPRFDAVILNGLWQYPGYALFKAAQRAGTPPYFIFPHGMLDPWFQRAPERRFKAIRNWCYWKLIEQHVIRKAAAVFFTCAEEMRLARDTFRPYQPKRQINVGYGVAQPPEYHQGMAEAFAQKCPGLKDRSYFLFLGRIHPKKGVDILIKAYAKIRSQKTEDGGRRTEGGGRRATDGGRRTEDGEQKSVDEVNRHLTPALSPSVAEREGQAEDGGRRGEDDGRRTADIRPLTSDQPPPPPPPLLIIAGPGVETPYGKQMQALASALCPSNSVYWPGMLTGEAKWGALYNAEAFVLTSHQENFGIAVAESLACGKPVLISNQINIWREIEEDHAGLVGSNTLAGAERLFRQWENLLPEDKAAMKRAAKASYENRFAIGLVAQNLLATIEDLTVRSHVEKQLSERE